MTPEQANFVRGMEKAGQLAAETLKYVGGFVKAGITTNELDNIAYEYILSKGAKPAPLHYHGYPKSICTSINEVICHGVPDRTKLKDGDIINIDVTVILNGYYGDTSFTYPVGEITAAARDLVEAARQAMYEGIEAITPTATTGDIGFAINKYVTRKGYYAVREIGGHGIGTIFHDEPFVPSYGKKGKGDRLKLWKCITVEPMVNQTSAGMTEHEIPGSTIMWYTMNDKSLSAQFEHTVLITDAGPRIMTLCD